MSGAMIREVALAAMRAGLSVHPPREDGSKAPLPLYRDAAGKSTWLHPPGERAGEEQIQAWYGPRNGIGLRCGSEGDGVECFEFDCPETHRGYKEAAAEAGLAELVERVEAGYLEATPGGGFHWLYTPETTRGSAKLAVRPDPTEENPRRVKTLIETKGENGFVIVAPSGGTVHPSGRPYTLTRGGFDTIASVTDEEREALYELARSFDQTDRPQAEPSPRTREPAGGVLPGEDFNRRMSWDDVLEPAGWAMAYSKGDTTYWRRPDKPKGVSATTNHKGADNLHVFSTSTPFDTAKSYTKFGAYAVLHHRGDFSAAARALRKEGYGAEPGAVAHHARNRRARVGDNGQHDGASPAARREPGDDGLGDDAAGLPDLHPDGRPPLPSIICGFEGPAEGLKSWTPRALEALAMANAREPVVFQRAKELVRLGFPVDGEDDPPTIESLCLDALRGILDRAACWGNTYMTKKGPVVRYGAPRLEIVRDILALGTLDAGDFPPIEAIAEAPMFAADGRLILEPGYHRESRLYYAPSAGLRGLVVPDRPSPEDVRWALGLIFGDLLCDFPFANEASKANALVVMLLPFVRLMIDGPTPNHHFTSSTEGVGKGKCAKACAMPYLGRELDIIPQKESEAEWRKTITSFLMSGASHCFIDNIRNPLGWGDVPLDIESGVLCAAWTGGRWRDRILQTQDEARFKLHAVFMSSGNNVSFSRELARRLVLIELIPSSEDPSLRRDFRHKNLEGWAKENRADLVRACLILCLNWLARDRPRGTELKGSYEAYCETMGGILDAAGVAGFLGNRPKSGRDRESLRWPALVRAWHADRKGLPTTTGYIYDLIYGDKDFAGIPDLQVAFADVVGDGKELSRKQKFGHAISRQAGRVWGTSRIVRTTSNARNGTPLYKLVDPNVAFQAEDEEWADGRE